MDQSVAAWRALGALAGLRPGARAALAGAELARARRAYQGSLEAARAWRAFSPHSRHHTMTYWSLLAALFAAPGLTRTQLADRIVAYAGVSRSTAQRAIREARRVGHVAADRPSGRAVRYVLADRLLDHCVLYFQKWLDRGPLAKALGYAREVG
jgi:hypothetical protein